MAAWLNQYTYTSIIYRLALVVVSGQHHGLRWLASPLRYTEVASSRVSANGAEKLKTEMEGREGRE